MLIIDLICNNFIALICSNSFHVYVHGNVIFIQLHKYGENHIDNH